jgi:hypothetical protein
VHHPAAGSENKERSRTIRNRAAHTISLNVEELTAKAKPAAKPNLLFG